jgi:uncharacterized protein involved in exopolysaccharide biosynthesis
LAPFHPIWSLGMDLPFYLSRLLRRLHWVVLFAGIGLACGTGLAVMLPPVYVAQARLLVEAEQIPGDLALSTVRTQALAQLELTLQRILGADSLLELARHQKIYDSTDHRETQTDSLVRDMRSRIEMTQANGRDGPPLVSITFEASSPDLAANVTNEIARLILKEDIATRTKTALKTLEFFTQETARLEGELAAQDERILAFRQQNIDALPDSLTFRRGQLITGQERLLQVERQIGNLQERRAKMEHRQNTLLALGSGARTGFLTAEQVQLGQLQEELAAQSTLLSSQNPRLSILRAQVDALDQRVISQGVDRKMLGDRSEVLNDYELQSSEVAEDLNFLIERKDQIVQSLSVLATSIEETTANAITLGNLERDQANTRLQHDQAVANKARAETGKTIETLRQGQHISLFEPASVPLRPQGPTPAFIIGAGLAAGLISGLALVFLLEVTWKGLRRAEDLTDALGIIPFATLPYLSTRTEILRRRAVVAATVAAFVVGIPVGIWAMQIYPEKGDLFMGAAGPTDAAPPLPAQKG